MVVSGSSITGGAVSRGAVSSGVVTGGAVSGPTKHTDSLSLLLALKVTTSVGGIVYLSEGNNNQFVCVPRITLDITTIDLSVYPE